LVLVISNETIFVAYYNSDNQFSMCKWHNKENGEGKTYVLVQGWGGR